MLGFFKKKETTYLLKDLVWISANAKMKGCIELLSKYTDKNVILVAWFEESKNIFEQLLLSNQLNSFPIVIAKAMNAAQVQQKTVLFIEHYPLQKKEIELYASWQAKEIFFLNSLDEPLFKIFGCEQIATIMQSMGIKEDEYLEHALITSSIANAQAKLEKKIVVDNAARSANEWFNRNSIL